MENLNKDSLNMNRILTERQKKEEAFVRRTRKGGLSQWSQQKLDGC